MEDVTWGSPDGGDVRPGDDDLACHGSWLGQPDPSGPKAGGIVAAKHQGLVRQGPTHRGE